MIKTTKLNKRVSNMVMSAYSAFPNPECLDLEFKGSGFSIFFYHCTMGICKSKRSGFDVSVFTNPNTQDFKSRTPGFQFVEALKLAELNVHSVNERTYLFKPMFFRDSIRVFMEGSSAAAVTSNSSRRSFSILTKSALQARPP